jgi:RNA polymerase sigma-70 factor (ECF subfamily)
MADNRWLEARFADIRPRAVAALTRRFRDIDLAEEAFAEACLRALRSWPQHGTPDDPFAWLVSAGRNHGIDRLRAHQRRSRLLNDLEGPGESDDPEAEALEAIDNDGLRDDVLRLFFICCHPALTTADQLCLALKIVGGLGVEEIARAFLVKPKAMEQRITRAKRTIAAADIPFDTPDLRQRNARFQAVSLMLYLLFNEGWSATSGTEQIRSALCEEAIRLARLLLQLYPQQSEMMGLLALFLLQHARARARVDGAGNLIALDQQDRRLWDRRMIDQGRNLIEKALRRGASGTYQIQAAIAGEPGCGQRRGYRLDRNRATLRRPGADRSVAGGAPQPRRFAVQGQGAGRRAGHDRAAVGGT